METEGEARIVNINLAIVESELTERRTTENSRIVLTAS